MNGGLDLALAEVLDAESVFVADVCKVNKDGSVGHHEPHRSPCSILAHRFPGVPNLGDVSKVDWHEVAEQYRPIDILCGGYPCQPFSHAGKRLGTDDPRHLWPYVVRAIDAIRPNLLFFENVRGHLTLGFDEVLTDLAALNYAVDWTIVAASDVGAAHKRERLFILGRNCGALRSRAS